MDKRGENIDNEKLLFQKDKLTEILLCVKTYYCNVEVTVLISAFPFHRHYDAT